MNLQGPFKLNKELFDAYNLPEPNFTIVGARDELA